MTPLICLAIALHDVDGPIHCVGGPTIRLQGVGALELDGKPRGAQPFVPGDPFEQRRRMALAIGAEILRDEPGPNGRLWFVRPIELTCDVTGRSFRRTTAWCATPGGLDVSCLAIRINVAARWPAFDRGRRLEGCAR